VDVGTPTMELDVFHDASRTRGTAVHDRRRLRRPSDAPTRRPGARLDVAVERSACGVDGRVQAGVIGRVPGLVS
jgi:hypothetical protein